MREETSTSARLSALKSVDLPGVGVADQRDRAERNGVARVAAQRALLADFVDGFLNFGDAIANAATVGLEFLFAGAADADAAAPPPAPPEPPPPLLPPSRDIACPWPVSRGSM